MSNRTSRTPSVKDDLICPISKDIMSDPVIASDGFTYDRRWIEDWIRKFGNSRVRSPMTNRVLSNTNLVPNRAIRGQIQEYHEQNGTTPPSPGFQVFVKDMNNKTKVLQNVKRKDTISSLMRKVYEKTGVKIEYQRLTFAGKNLQRKGNNGSKRLIGDYNIQEGSTIELLTRLLGGDVSCVM